MSSPTDTPANSKVRAKLLRGEPVRFDAEKQTEKEREVPAQWVAEALREGRRVKQKNAILTGRLDLQSAHVEQEFILLGGEVRGPVNASYVRFARWVLFHNVRFQDSVSFEGARFAAELNCTGTHFLKSVNFEDSIIEGSFAARGAQFGSSEEDSVGFNNCEIRRDAAFVLAVFHGPAQFIDLTVGKQANFSGARFEQAVGFDGAKIGGAFFFRPKGEQRVEFGGAARFHGVKVSGQADFSGARFRQKAGFDGAEFNGDFFFLREGEQRVEFGGAARFHGVKVSGQANFSGARFRQAVGFDGAKIGGDFFFLPEGAQRVEFGGEARFPGVKVGGQADFSGARFEHGAAFDRMEIGGSFFFTREGEQGTEFGGKARFAGVKVGGQANFGMVQFEQEVSFQSATVEGEAGFVGAEFQEAVSFQRAQFKAGLYFSQAQSSPATFGGEAKFHGVRVGGQADFSGARFKHEAAFEGAAFSGVSFFREASFSDLVSFATARFQIAAEFQGVRFHGPVYFDYARFEQEAHFAGAQFHAGLNLRDARMTTLSFLEEQEGKEKKVAVFHSGFKVDLLGCTYDRLEIDGWRKLLDLAKFHLRSWIHLEKVFRTGGREDDARAVYYDRRLREGNLIPRERLSRWFVDRLHRHVAGYGVQSQLGMLILLFLLLLGTWVFQRPGAVIPAKEGPARSEHLAAAEEGGASSPEEMVELEWDSALGFSFKQLLPVPIPLLRRYEPAPGWPSLYASLHLLLGIFFITTAFATLSGLMRRAHPD